MGKSKFVLLVLACLIATAASAAQETGMASVYSTKFQGSRTANGEVFSHTQFTAAHRTLPFNTLVKITRTDNGKSVIVRINDRGPFVSERVTDVSKAAASKLGIAKDDTEVRVKLEVVPDRTAPLGSSLPNSPKRNDSPLSTERRIPVPMPEIIEYAGSKGVENTNIPRDYRFIPKKNEVANTATQKKNAQSNITSTPTSSAKNLTQYGLYAVKSTSSDKKGFAVQVASLSSHESMVRTVADLKSDSFRNILVQTVKGRDGDPDYKILLGPFDNKTSADGYLKNIQKHNLKGFVVDLKSFK